MRRLFLTQVLVILQDSCFGNYVGQSVIFGVIVLRLGSGMGEERRISLEFLEVVSRRAAPATRVTSWPLLRVCRAKQMNILLFPASCVSISTFFQSPSAMTGSQRRDIWQCRWQGGGEKGAPPGRWEQDQNSPSRGHFRTSTQTEKWTHLWTFLLVIFLMMVNPHST